MTDSTINPREWDEIRNTSSDSSTVVLDGWFDFGDGARVYDGSMYVHVNGGWVSLEDVVEAMSEFVEQMGEYMEVDDD